MSEDFANSGNTVEQNQESPLHPHERGGFGNLAPVYDPEGRCLICSIMVQSDELRAWADGRKSRTNLSHTAPEKYPPDVVAAMDAQEVLAI
jgi:hypothetical protein